MSKKVIRPTEVSKFTKQMKDKAEEHRVYMAGLGVPYPVGDPVSFSRVLDLDNPEKELLEPVEQIDYTKIKEVIDENNRAAKLAHERMVEFTNRDRLTRLKNFMLDIDKKKYKDLLDKYEEALKDLDIKEIHEFVNKYKIILTDAFDDLAAEREEPLLQFYFSTTEDNRKAVFSDWETLKWESEPKESKFDKELKQELEELLLAEEPVVNLEHLGLYEVPVSTVELAFQIMKEVGYGANKFSGNLNIEDHKEFIEIAIMYKELVSKIEKVTTKAQKESKRKQRSIEMAKESPGFRRVSEQEEQVEEVKEEPVLEDFSWKDALMGAMVSGVVAAIASNKEVAKEVDYETSSGA